MCFCYAHNHGAFTFTITISLPFSSSLHHDCPITPLVFLSSLSFTIIPQISSFPYCIIILSIISQHLSATISSSSIISMTTANPTVQLPPSLAQRPHSQGHRYNTDLRLMRRGQGPGDSEKSQRKSLHLKTDKNIFNSYFVISVRYKRTKQAMIKKIIS